MKLVDVSVGRPVTTMMVYATLVILGAISFTRLPLAFLPEVDIPAVWILVPYPNSSPAQVERLVTRPVEEALAQLKGVKRLTSTSGPDGAQIQLEFTWGQSIDLIRMAIGEKIDQVKPELPAEVRQIQIFNFSTSDIPVVQARISAHGVDLSKNFDLLDKRIADPLRRIKGVGRVELGGVSKKEIRIFLLSDKLREHAVDVPALVTRLATAGVSVPVGSITSGPLTYNARVVTDVTEMKELEDIPVRPGVRLADVARIEYREPPEADRRHLDLEPAVALEIFKESTANTVEVAREAVRMIKNEIARDPTLQGVNVFTWDDQASQIENGLDGIRKSGVEGAFLAVMFIYLFLRRWDATTVVAVSIPLSLIIAGTVMYFMGKSLNVLSMTGLMLGVGMLVDDSIVVLESIASRFAKGEGPRSAALSGTRHVSAAVVSSTLTSVAVFLPLVVGGKNELSVWLGEIGGTITVALLCSLVVSLTLVPLLSSRMLGKARAARPNVPIEKLTAAYKKAIGWTLVRPWKSFALLVLVIVVGILPVLVPGLVDMTMFTGTVNRRLYIDYAMSDFFYAGDVGKVVTEVEKYFLAHKEAWGIESVYTYYGENHARTVLTLAKKDLGDREIKALRTQMKKGLPSFPAVKVRFDEEQDAGGRRSDFEVTLRGDDVAVLAGLADQAERRLARMGGISDVFSDAHSTRQEIRATLDKERAAALGVSPSEMAQLFAFTLGGFPLRKISDGQSETEMSVALAPEDSESLDDLRELTLTTRDGNSVRVGDVATFKIVRRPAEIHREGRMGALSVRMTYEGEKVEQVRRQIERVFETLPYPPGYGWQLGQGIQDGDDQAAQMMQNFLLALLLVFVIMAAQFESLVHPFAIVMTLPFGLFGVWWTLALTRTPFNIMSRIGLLILIGIAVKNGIVLIDIVKQLRAAGVPREQALIDGGAERLRPILMTALATMVGLVPLALGGSAVGDAYYFPLARTVIGGLLANTVLTLLVLPYMYQQVDRFTTWCKSLWRASSPRAAALAAPVAA
ncbi:MAG: efflux RND transporter permease subunit [Acidobacteriota bacterium]